MLRRLRLPGLLLGVLFIALQLVPYGRDHTNPPVVADAPWPGAEARRLAVAACYDCHSQRDPLAPLQPGGPRLVASHPRRRRRPRRVHFSRWDEDGDEADKAAEEAEEGTMPPRRYQLAHPDARLSGAERRALVAALTAMKDNVGNRAQGGGDDDRRGSNRGRQ